MHTQKSGSLRCLYLTSRFHHSYNASPFSFQFTFKKYNLKYQALHKVCPPAFLLLVKYRQMANFFSRIINWNKKLITKSFSYCQNSIQFDHFSSIWANFHQFVMIPSNIWRKVLHFLFHWWHMLDKWKFVGKTLMPTYLKTCNWFSVLSNIILQEQ
jgi:hypothetical protein